MRYENVSDFAKRYAAASENPDVKTTERQAVWKSIYLKAPANPDHENTKHWLVFKFNRSSLAFRGVSLFNLSSTHRKMSVVNGRKAVNEFDRLTGCPLLPNRPELLNLLF